MFCWVVYQVYKDIVSNAKSCYSPLRACVTPPPPPPPWLNFKELCALHIFPTIRYKLILFGRIILLYHVRMVCRLECVTCKNAGYSVLFYNFCLLRHTSVWSLLNLLISVWRTCYSIGVHATVYLRYLFHPFPIALWHQIKSLIFRHVV